MTPHFQASTARSATALGLLAILIWSTSVALIRSLSCKLGIVTMVSSVYTTAGLLMIGVEYGLRKKHRGLARLPRRYFVACGLMFIIYLLCFNIALKLAQTDARAIEISLINYLWPAMTLAFSVPVLGTKARWRLLIPGMLVATLGVALARIGYTPTAWQSFAENLYADLLPSILAFFGALFWSLYSIYSSRWAEGSNATALPIFIFVSGLMMGLALPFVNEQPVLDRRAWFELAGIVFFTTILAYSCWDLAMRKGKVTLVVTASYFTPVLSVLFGRYYLEAAVGPNVWIGGGFVVAGALLCRLGIRYD